MELFRHGIPLTASVVFALLVQLCTGVWGASKAGKGATQAIGPTSQQELRQYCQWDAFNATCGIDEIILMQSAKYGRMRFGGCVKENHGHIGCSADVLSHLDRMCSGRHHCVMNIPDETLHKIHACPKELMSYLEAKFTCAKVATTAGQLCGRYKPLELSSSSGFLSSTVADNTGFGTNICPWSVKVRPGQQVKLTLYNFIHSTPASGKTQGRFCETYITITERGKSRNITSCVGDSREKYIVTSGSNTIQVGILPAARDVNKARRFLIKYEALGCADLVPKPNSYVKRMGNTAIVKCNFTDETFFLSCDTDQWIGELGNCSKTSTWKGNSALRLPSRFPYGILVVIGIGVALGVAMGIILLMSILIFIKRRKERALRSATTDPLLQDVPHESDENGAQCNCGAKIYYSTRLECQMQLARQHEQMRMLQQQQQGQPPTDGDTDTGGENGPLPMPDMCMVETFPIRRILNSEQSNTEGEESGGEGGQLQTSFITFKPQNIPLPCRGCKEAPFPVLKRADKSSSHLPHYGRLTRAGCIGDLDDCDNTNNLNTVKAKTMERAKNGPTPGCLECARDWSSNKELSTNQTADQSV